MDQVFIVDMFEKLRNKLSKYTSYHAEQYDIYNGKWSPSSLGISVSPELDAKIKVNLDWGKISVDQFVSQLNFDLVENDQWGVMDYFNYGNADRVIKSAIKNSAVSACSFVSVTPGNVEVGEPPVIYTPYTGYEATGFYNSRTGKLDIGIAIESYKDGEPVSYLLFMPDATYRMIEGEAPVKLFDSNFGCQLILFPFDQDLASNPFGRSRNNGPQKSLVGSAIRTLKRSELSSEFFASPLRYVFTKGFEDASSSLESWNSTIGQLLMANTEPNDDNPEIGQLGTSDPTPYIKQFNMFAEQFAAGACMNAQEFGVAPANGSLSADAESERRRKMVNLLNESKSVYGECIKQMALHTISIVSGQFVPEMYKMSVAWVNSVVESDLGRIGDSLGKLFAVVPELSSTDIAFEKLGISKRSRIDNDGGLSSSPEQRLKGLSDELKEIIRSNAETPDNNNTDYGSTIG